ncbi:MAG TPA: UDP-N-acetylmuramoyl-L-alanyl-D-glutamate--2,6-diaminopimelate ligase [Candidatus Saccharimonadia bacterium]|nr:UDP-N-acetylmuramoyl-L-alanyl-D-glutamate--2,6-diaminopimelate ligase [Candidatus Saccharimonadia bacterium]
MNPRRLVKKLIPRNLFAKVEPYGHLIEAMIAQALNGFPAKDLVVIGVTGTDGKTSTATFIHQLLVSNGYKSSMMSTISVDYGDGQGLKPNPTRMTVMDVSDLVRSIKKIKATGTKYLVLETTSHALAQRRVWGIPYSIAVLTNIYHEHLDYHKTFNNYLNAKLRMFQQTDSNKKGYRVGIINDEDKYATKFVKSIKNPITYGIKSGDITASDIKISASGSTYAAKINGDIYHITCNIPGTFNISNSLAAILVGRTLGLSVKQIEKGIAELKSVEGRMTYVDEGQNFGVIVDYAHTPDSFEVVFKEAKKITNNRIIVVFGSAGRRDEEKRSIQGEIAGEYCDIVIATEEDDRDVDGEEILSQIAKGAEKAGKELSQNLFLIHDRTRAVAKAIDMAKPGDLVLLLGKGHEKSILTNGPQATKMRHLLQDDTDARRVIKKDYDEVTVARDCLKKSLKRD